MTGISTKKDIEYIKAVFNDLSEALTQMAYGQVVPVSYTHLTLPTTPYV